MPLANAYLVATTEFVGGSFLIVGLMSRLATVPLTVTMIVAILTAKLSEITEISDLFSMSEFLYILIFIWLMIAGPGLVSIDSIWCRKKRR